MIPDFHPGAEAGQDRRGLRHHYQDQQLSRQSAGRVCPQENQCEKNCVRAIRGEAVAIGRLERYVADHHTPVLPEKPQPNGVKVAVVGSGPAGLACAADLAKEGFRGDDL